MNKPDKKMVESLNYKDIQFGVSKKRYHETETKYNI